MLVAQHVGGRFAGNQLGAEDLFVSQASSQTPGKTISRLPAKEAIWLRDTLATVTARLYRFG